MSRPRAVVHPPRQARSRDTLERFAAAAVRLLETRQWAQVSVAELAQAAQASVGAFYTRFPDKQALLEYLDERYADEMVRLLRRHADQAQRHELPLEVRVERLLGSLVRLFRRYRGLLATVVLEARTGNAPTFAARTRRMNAELPRLARSLAGSTPDLDPADVRTAMAFTFSALRDQVLFPDSIPAAGGRRLRNRELTSALLRNFMGYLKAGRVR